LEWIQENAESKAQIEDCCRWESQVSVTQDWVNSLALRHADDILQTKSSLQENQSL
jgi:hypothetical protein